MVSVYFFLLYVADAVPVGQALRVWVIFVLVLIPNDLFLETFGKCL